MGFNDVFNLLAVFLGSLGGGALIIFIFANWLGKVWANRLMTKEKAEHARELESLRNRLIQDTESYKIKLKKSEFLFQKEFEAASGFIALKGSFIPTYSHPFMDYYEGCDEIARNFDDIEIAITSYISQHGAVLQPTVKKLLYLSIGIAGKNKFAASGEKIPKNVNDEADKLYKMLDELETILLEQVLSQSST